MLLDWGAMRLLMDGVRLLGAAALCYLLGTGVQECHRSFWELPKTCQCSCCTCSLGRLSPLDPNSRSAEEQKSIRALVGLLDNSHQSIRTSGHSTSTKFGTLHVQVPSTYSWAGLRSQVPNS